jgi:hypothetical protein
MPHVVAALNRALLQLTSGRRRIQFRDWPATNRQL